MADKLENVLDTGVQPPGGETDGGAVSATAVTIDWDLYARFKDYAVREVFVDKAVSGGALERPGLQALIAYLQRQKNTEPV